MAAEQHSSKSPARRKAVPAFSEGRKEAATLRKSEQKPGPDTHANASGFPIWWWWNNVAS